MSHLIDIVLSRKGLRKKDPGYVGITENTDFWRDSCEEWSTSFKVVFYYHHPLSKEKRDRKGKGCIDAEPTVLGVSVL